MKYICQLRHTCNNRCDIQQFKHHDRVWIINDEILLEEELNDLYKSFAPDITCHDLTKEMWEGVMLVYATLSPIRLCNCNGPCMQVPTLEPCEA